MALLFIKYRRYLTNVALFIKYSRYLIYTAAIICRYTWAVIAFFEAF